MDITQLILDDHHEQRRLFAILEQVGRTDTTALSAVWARLGAFLEIHAAAEEAIFYPALLQVGLAAGRRAGAEEETLDAISDHNDIRDAVAEVARHLAGSDDWVAAVAAANLANGGLGAVALPALAHAHWGAAGYGALLACMAAGAVIGALAAARSGRLQNPAVVASGAFVIESGVIALVPYLGGEAGAAAALLVLGICNGLGNVLFFTMAQRSIPRAILGRVMSVIILCSFGTFPLSVVVAGLLIHHIGPSPFFPIAGAFLVVAVLGGNTQREFRAFGRKADPVAAERPVETADRTQ